MLFFIHLESRRVDIAGITVHPDEPYELAHRAALQAQHAYNLERGFTTRRFVADWGWDGLHAGLLAGERLESSLHHMEMAYLNENVREYELAKHFSLRLHFPMAYLRLRATGCCEIDIPEWMFDLDYPGHYMRRIRNVTHHRPLGTTCSRDALTKTRRRKRRDRRRNPACVLGFATRSPGAD